MEAINFSSMKLGDRQVYLLLNVADLHKGFSKEMKIFARKEVGNFSFEMDVKGRSISTNVFIYKRTGLEERNAQGISMSYFQFSS